MYSVAIVEDHTLLLQAIAEIVNRFENFEVSFQCKNGADLIHKLQTSESLPDIALMDVNMPLMNGIETTQWLTANHIGIKVLALTVVEDENIIVKMLRSGARGYLLKDVDKNTLEMAMSKVMETGYYHSNTITNILFNSLSGRVTNTPIIKKTESEFLKLLCTELTYKEIADRMFLSPKTIDGYRDNLFVKLNVKNRIGLVLYAIKNNIFIP